jgi:hypothetical protein
VKRKNDVWQLVYFLLSIYSYFGLGIEYSGLSSNLGSDWLWE